MNNLYLAAKRLDSAEVLALIQNAKSEEERNFYAYIADMNLQRRQREYIAKEAAHYGDNHSEPR